MKPITWRQIRREHEQARRRNKIKSVGAKSWTAIWTTAIMIFAAFMLAQLIFMWIMD